MPFPRHPVALLYLASTVVVPAAVAWFAADRLSSAPAFAAAVGALAALAATGCLLLRTSPLGAITWRNRLAGWLMPWANLFGPGSLGRLWASSVLGNLVVAGIVVLFVALARRDQPAPWSLLGAWLLDAVVVLYLLATLTRSHLRGSSAGRRLLRMVALVVLQFGASVGLHLAGSTAMAVGVAAGPQLVVLAVWLAWVVVILTVGRNARWN
ncbi:MAG: hypothetical protein JNK78_05920 [Planctomycetes bacterium]|nr:hypothetical protein [Planctomycetota bacterium]